MCVCVCVTKYLPIDVSIIVVCYNHAVVFPISVFEGEKLVQRAVS